MAAFGDFCPKLIETNINFKYQQVKNNALYFQIQKLSTSFPCCFKSPTRCYQTVRFVTNIFRQKFPKIAIVGCKQWLQQSYSARSQVAKKAKMINEIDLQQLLVTAQQGFQRFQISAFMIEQEDGVKKLFDQQMICKIGN